MPSRRAYLATLVAVGLAGCVDDPPGTDSPESDSPADSPTASPTPTDSAAGSADDVVVEAAAVQYAYRHIESVDWNAIQPADGQFVFVTVDAGEAQSPPDPTAITLVADGERYDHEDIADRMPVDLEVGGSAYLPDRDGAENRGWLAFETPAQLDDDPTLRLEAGSEPRDFDLSSDRATSAPPEWEFDVDAPGTVAPESTFDIATTAENVGDGAGTFRGAVNFSSPHVHAQGVRHPPRSRRVRYGDRRSRDRRRRLREGDRLRDPDAGGGVVGDRHGRVTGTVEPENCG